MSAYDALEIDRLSNLLMAFSRIEVHTKIEKMFLELGSSKVTLLTSQEEVAFFRILKKLENYFHEQLMAALVKAGLKTQRPPTQSTQKEKVGNL